jgi:hypothetical protein
VSKIKEEDREYPFGVDGSNEPDPKEAEFSGVYSSKSEAVDVFTKIKYRYKWLCEIGVCDLGNGEMKETWVYYFWSSENPAYGDPPPTGQGLDIDDMKRFYCYEPIAH